MSKSRIYREITARDIDKIVKDLYGSGTILLSSKILKGGMFNTTYLLHTNRDDTGLVLRVGPVNKQLLFKFEKDMMAAEPVFHRLLQDNGIPTSNVLKYSSSDSVIDRDYIVIEYIDSIPMNDDMLANLDLSDVYEEIGRLTHHMHTIKNDKFGWLRTDGWGLYDTWAGFIGAFAFEAAEKAEEYSLFSREEIKTFRTFVEDNSSILDRISTPYYIHSDLWQGNILLSKENDTYKVAAIIDLDRTIFGDKYWDFSTPWIINGSFLKGYRDNIDKTAEYETRQTIYKLLGGFFGAYVCLVEYDDDAWYQREKEKVVSLLPR